MAVYFIQDGNGHVKIGHSHDPKCRLRAVYFIQRGGSSRCRSLELSHRVDIVPRSRSEGRGFAHQ